MISELKVWKSYIVVGTAAGCLMGAQKEPPMSLWPAGTRCPANYAAGYLCTGAAGWLGCKIIRMLMDDDCSANDLVYGKTVRQKHGERKAMVSKQRWQVACMAGMLTAVRIVMGHGVCERVLHIAHTRSSLVDMKSKNLFRTRTFAAGQAADLRPDGHALSGLVKSHYARNAGITLAACDMCRRLRSAAQNGEEMGLGIAAG